MMAESELVDRQPGRIEPFVENGHGPSHHPARGCSTSTLARGASMRKPAEK
jgi:hypothetical protein